MQGGDCRPSQAKLVTYQKRFSLLVHLSNFVRQWSAIAARTVSSELKQLSYYIGKITLHILTAGYIKLGTHNFSLNRKRKRIKVFLVISAQLVEVYHNITSDNIIWNPSLTYSFEKFTYTAYRVYSLYNQNTASLLT